MTELIAHLKDISLQVAVLGRNIVNLEYRCRQVNQGRKDRGSRLSSEETIETWVWYEGSRWFRVEQDMSWRQKRKASRAVRQALGQDGKSWREVDWTSS